MLTRYPDTNCFLFIFAVSNQKRPKVREIRGKPELGRGWAEVYVLLRFGWSVPEREVGLQQGRSFGLLLRIRRI